MIEEQYTMWGYWSEEPKEWDSFYADTLSLNYYQQEAMTFVVTEDQGTRLMEHTLGLVGEAGEVAEKVKKAVRDDTELSREDLLKELGDVLFYVAALADLLDEDLGKVGTGNLEKLRDRKARGVIKGMGDTR